MDDIVDRLRIAETALLDADGKVSLFLVLQDARAEIARLREERRWIPVTERLPDRDRCRRVIVALTPDSRGNVEVCDAAHYEGSDFETEYGVYECSHWMPLPAPPGGEVEG